MEIKVGEGQRAERRLKINVRVRDRHDASRWSVTEGLAGQALPQVKNPLSQRPPSHSMTCPSVWLKHSRSLSCQYNSSCLNSQKYSMIR